MKNLNRQTDRDSRRSGFTLIELLLVIAIIAILSSLGLAIMAGAEENALESRTRAQLERISQVLNQKLEEDIYRIIPFRLTVGTNPQTARDFRKDLIAELIRVELPSNRDAVDQSVMFPVGDPGGLGIQAQLSSVRPRISERYAALINSANATIPSKDWYTKTSPPPVSEDPRQLERVSAECLYAIMSLHTDEHGHPLISLIASNEIGDTDGDGVKEVLDAFGDPLVFRVVDAAGNTIDPATATFNAQEYRVLITSPNTLRALN